MPRPKDSVSSLVSLSSRVIAKHDRVNYVKNAHLLQHVLPKTTPTSCVAILKEKGPAFWKELDMVSDTNKQHEKVQLLMLTNPSLQLLLPIYFYLWNQETERVPVHIYEMGWGHNLQSGATSPQHMYLESLNIGVGKDPLRITPLLGHDHHYFPYNVNYNSETHSDNEGPEYNINNLETRDIYYLKLFSAQSCTKRERWSECFAHCMSALDHHREFFPYIHNLFCMMALAAGKMSLHIEFWLDFLLKAQDYDYFIYNKWRRIVVLQSILVHHGLFDKERIVFKYAAEEIPPESGFRVQLMTQHIYALMAQIENIAAFQFLRQQFHENCNTSACNKPILYNYSFAKSMHYILEMERCLCQIPEEGHRHYFQGYVYLYKTFVAPFVETSDKDAALLKCAISSFQIAEMDLKEEETSALKADLTFIKRAVEKKVIDDTTICEAYSAMTNMEFNVEAANTCFRVALIDMYWDDHINGVKGLNSNLCETAHEVYIKSTMLRGYRSTLLKACHRFHQFGIEGHFEMGEQDYPPVECMSPILELKESFDIFWDIEKDFIANPKSPNTQKCSLTSYDLLETSQERMELFAYGADILSKLSQSL